MRPVMVSMALLAALGLPSTVLAQEPQEKPREYRIELTDLNPLVITRGANIEISGSLTNLSQQVASGVTLKTSVGNVLRGRSELPLINSTSQLNNPRLVNPTGPVRLGDLSIGQSKNFVFVIDSAELGLISDGVYPIEVSALSGASLLDRTVTTLPLLQTPTSNLSTSVLWPIVAPPAQSGPETAFGDLLPNQMIQAGSLDAILNNLSPDFTLIIDPAIAKFSDTASKSYFVTDGQAIRVGTDSTEIASWHENLLQGQQTNEAWLTPYANPEIFTNQRGRISQLLNNAYRISETELNQGPPSQIGVISMLTSGFNNQSLVEVAQRSQAVVLSSRLVSSNKSLNHTPSARISWSSLGLANQVVPLFIADSQISEAFKPLTQVKGLSDQALALMVRQQLASELTMLSLERPSQASVVLVTPPPYWTPTIATAVAAKQALSSGPWVKAITLSRAARSPVGLGPFVNASPESNEKSKSLRPRQIELVKEGALIIEQLSSIAVGPSNQLDELRLGLNRALSTAWVKRVKIGRKLASLVNEEISQTYLSVSVVASPDLTLTGQLGALPVSVTNGLDVPIKVSLATSSILGAQVDLTSASDLLVPANQSLALDVPIEIQGSVPNQIDLYLVNSEGNRVGSSAVVEIRTTAYSQIAQWISIISLVLVIVLVTISLSRKIKTKATRKQF